MTEKQGWQLTSTPWVAARGMFWDPVAALWQAAAIQTMKKSTEGSGIDVCCVSKGKG